MKNMMKIWVLISVSSLFAFSCQKNEVALENENPSEKSFRTITLNFPTDPETKMSMAEDGKTAWEVNDEIMIHGAKVGKNGDVYYSRIITLKEENIHDSGKTATFTLEDIDADAGWGRSGYKATLFAAYPASALVDYADGDYWYYSSAWDQTNTLLMAGTNDTSVNDGNTFTFTHLTGVLSFVVSGDFDSYVFSGNGGSEVVGYDVFAVRVDTGSSFGDKNKIPYNGASGGLGFSGAKTSISASVVADGSTINYIYFPGGVDLANGFTIKFMKGGIEQKRISTDTGKNIARGQYLKLGDVTSHLYTYTPPATHNATHPAISGAENLSASGTANSYIVDASDDANKDKVFKFKAVKGNSSTGVGKIGNVVVLWETYNNAETVTANSVIAQADFDKQAGDDDYWITFQMPSTLHAGNAVIAAKNAGGDILWSWHIWIPQTTINNINGSNILGATIMDRNIGALEATAASGAASITSTGLIYQWGRKDPFIGLGSWDSSAPANVAGTAPTLGGQMSIAEAIANPTVYGVKSDGDWLKTTDDSRWGATKTIYDPCPPGYRIASGEKGSSSKYPLWNSSNIATAVTGKGMTWEFSEAEYRVKIVDGSNVLTYPIAGYISDGASEYKVSYRKERAAIWFYPTNTTSKYHLNLRKDGTYQAGSTSAARGCYVRCVVE